MLIFSTLHIFLVNSSQIQSEKNLKIDNLDNKEIYCDTTNISKNKNQQITMKEFLCLDNISLEDDLSDMYTKYNCCNVENKFDSSNPEDIFLSVNFNDFNAYLNNLDFNRNKKYIQKNFEYIFDNINHFEKFKDLRDLFDIVQRDFKSILENSTKLLHNNNKLLHDMILIFNKNFSLADKIKRFLNVSIVILNTIFILRPLTLERFILIDDIIKTKFKKNEHEEIEIFNLKNSSKSLNSIIKKNDLNFSELFVYTKNLISNLDNVQLKIYIVMGLQNLLRNDSIKSMPRFSKLLIILHKSKNKNNNYNISWNFEILRIFFVSYTYTNENIKQAMEKIFTSNKTLLKYNFYLMLNSNFIDRSVHNYRQNINTKKNLKLINSLLDLLVSVKCKLYDLELND